jgi:hypothetical protein
MYIYMYIYIYIYTYIYRDKSAAKYVKVFREALASPPHISPLPF